MVVVVPEVELTVIATVETVVLAVFLKVGLMGMQTQTATVDQQQVRPG